MHFRVIVILIMLLASLPPFEETSLLNAQQATGTSVVITARDDFSFAPNDIEVSPGQKLVFTNEGFALHSLISEELGIEVEPIANRESVIFEIPRNARVGGSFTFSCGVVGHEEAGMTGTFKIISESQQSRTDDDDVEAESTISAGDGFDSLIATIETQEQQIADLEATVEAQATTIAELEADSTDNKSSSRPAPAIASTPATADSAEIETFTISGTFVLIDDEARISGQSCTGSRGYNDIHDGTQIVVTDGEGTLLGIGRLEYADSIRGVGCEFSFEVEVESATYYRIEITRRGEMIYTFEEMEENNWEVSLSLGS